LSDAHAKKRALKRGGEMQFVSWDDWMAEAPSHLQIPGHAIDSWPAERLFDVRWAATVAEQALRRLQAEFEQRGRRRVFDVLSGCLAAERVDVCYALLAKQLSVSELTVKRLVHQLRRGYRTMLREEVAKTVEDDADVEEEIRYLCAALAHQE
jgi:RNA polymerase sigma-70 factor (ECF subfamily)